MPAKYRADISDFSARNPGAIEKDGRASKEDRDKTAKLIDQQISDAEERQMFKEMLGVDDV